MVIGIGSMVVDEVITGATTKVVTKAKETTTTITTEMAIITKTVCVPRNSVEVSSGVIYFDVFR